MADRKRGLGRGIGALIPQSQQEHQNRAIDVFFGSNVSRETVVGNGLAEHSVEDRVANVSRETLKSETNVSRETSSDEENVSRETGGEAEDLLPVPGATYGEIPVHVIVPNTRQPRSVFDEDDLQELADSIAEVGVLQPIVVRPLQNAIEDNPNARYELIMGERRWRATQRAGLENIPAIIRHTEDSDLLRDALLENLHRAQLNPLEEAAAYQQLLDDFQITQEELSKKIARSRPQISNTLRLLKLPSLVQRRLAAGVLSAGHARALLGLNDPAQMEKLAQRIVAEGLSVRAVEEIVSLGEKDVETKSRNRHVSPYKDELDALAVNLGDRLETKVKVSMGARKGKVAIEFASIEDLNRILSILGESGISEA